MRQVLSLRRDVTYLQLEVRQRQVLILLSRIQQTVGADAGERVVGDLQDTDNRLKRCQVV